MQVDGGTWRVVQAAHVIGQQAEMPVYLVEKALRREADRGQIRPARMEGGAVRRARQVAAEPVQSIVVASVVEGLQGVDGDCRRLERARLPGVLPGCVP